MKKVSLIANAVLFLLLLTAVVFCFVQRAEAERQAEFTQEAESRAKASAQEALMQRNMAFAAQHEAAKQRELAEQHLRELEQALARCKGK